MDNWVRLAITIQDSIIGVIILEKTISGTGLPIIRWSVVSKIGILLFGMLFKIWSWPRHLMPPLAESTPGFHSSIDLQPARPKLSEIGG